MEPKDKIPIDLSGVEAINNLDTARMSLRWALERLHSFEKLKTELVEKLEHEQILRKKIEKEHQELQSVFALQPEDPHQRKLYYDKMQDFVLLALAGKLDIAPLVARELEAAKLKESAQLKLEQSREKESWYKQQEQDRAATQTRLEEYYAAKQKELDHKINTYRDELDEWVKGRLKNAEQQLKERYDLLSAAWTQEKAILLKEIGGCREKNDEQLRQIFELEKRLAETQETAHRASKSLIMETEQRKKIEEREEVLQTEQLVRLGSLQERGLRKEEALLKHERELEERLSAIASELRKKQSELESIKNIWEREKAISQDTLGQAEEKAEELEGQLRRKQSELENLKRESQQQKTALLQTLNRQEQESRAKLVRIEALEKGLENAEDVRKLESSARNAEMQKKIEELEKALEAERESACRTLEAEAVHRNESLVKSEQKMEGEKIVLQEALSREERRTQEQLSRIKELEKNLADAQEAARRASEITAHEIARRKKLEEFFGNRLYET